MLSNAHLQSLQIAPFLELSGREGVEGGGNNGPVNHLFHRAAETRLGCTGLDGGIGKYAEDQTKPFFCIPACIGAPEDRLGRLVSGGLVYMQYIAVRK